MPQNNKTSKSGNHFELCATFELNNIAIIMMEQGAPEVAFETFRGAVTALQMGTDAPGQAHGRATIRRSLQQAIQHATSLLTYNHNNTDKRRNTSTDLRVVSHLEATADFNSICFQQQEQQELVFHLIRIEDQDQSLLEQQSLNLLTSIILHNFAIASLCRIDSRFTDNATFLQMEQHPEFIGRAYEDAITIFQLARALLEEAASAAATADCNNDSSATTSCSSSSPQQSPLHGGTVSRAVCNMRAIVVKTLQQLLQHHCVQRYDEAFTCLSILSHIRALASVLNDNNNNNKATTYNNNYWSKQIQGQDLIAPAA